MKCNQPHPEFELWSLCPFPTKITLTAWVPLLEYVYVMNNA